SCSDVHDVALVGPRAGTHGDAGRRPNVSSGRPRRRAARLENAQARAYAQPDGQMKTSVFCSAGIRRLELLAPDAVPTGAVTSRGPRHANPAAAPRSAGYAALGAPVRRTQAHPPPP